MLYTPEHRARYQAYYATREREWAAKPSHWQKAVEAVAELYQARTILDYGAGPARKLEYGTRLPVTSYDPGVPEIAGAPMPADLVVCLHTLEHVEPPCIVAVTEHLLALTHTALFVVVSCEPSTKTLLDGTAWHTLVMPAAWWRGVFAGHENFRQIWPFWLPENQEAESVMLLERITC